MKNPPLYSRLSLLSIRRAARQVEAAFTLVEMLVVMGIIVLLIGLATPVVTSLSAANDVSKSVYDIAGILEQARAYAMSNNTYVYVGFHEADINTSEAGRQTEVSSKVGGRVSVAVIASKDGTRGYNVNSTDTWASGYGTGGNFLTIGKVQRFKNLHLVDLDAPPTNGGMTRGPYDSNGSPTKVPDAYNLGNATCQSVTSFEYPLGYPLSSSSQSGGNPKSQYTFARVIQYDPQGVARIQTSSNADSIVKLIEIGMQQSHGASAASLPKPASTGSIAALQIECMTGSTHIYRP